MLATFTTASIVYFIYLVILKSQPLLLGLFCSHFLCFYGLTIPNLHNTAIYDCDNSSRTTAIFNHDNKSRTTAKLTSWSNNAVLCKFGIVNSSFAVGLCLLNRVYLLSNIRVYTPTCSRPRENGVSGVYQFDGSGFSQLPQVRLHPERLSITFRFKTFWEEALLFLTVNEVTVSVQKSCRKYFLCNSFSCFHSVSSLEYNAVHHLQL